MKQRRGNTEETKKEEMDERLREVNKEERAIRKERVETNKRQSVMTTNVPTKRNGTPHTKDKDGITVLSANINSPAHWQQDSNQAELLKFFFRKNIETDPAGLQECA